MIVFKTFFKILYKNKFLVILYTALLLIFGTINMQTEDNSIDFSETKPDIMIVNKDEEGTLTKSFVKYLNNHANIIEAFDDEEKISDALFYRETNYVIYIPDNYSKDFLSGLDVKVDIKSTGDYQASIASLLVEKYLNTAKRYLSITSDEENLINNIEDTLNNDIKVTMTSKLDQSSLSKAKFYFNFESYSILACLIYIICLMLSTFNSEKIKKRMLVSSTDYKKCNRVLFLANILFAMVIWLLYLIFGIVLVKDAMLSINGIMFMINSFIFTLSATSIAFFIGNLTNNKETISGIVNVIALGSSFLCGAFVPQDFLPSSVLNIAHLLPTYYYIRNNELITTLEVVDINTLKPLLINAGIMILFIVILVCISNIISKYKRHIA